MRDLIEALSIMLQYGDNPSPTHCEHDMLHVYAAVRPEEFTSEELTRLEALGFSADEETGGFYSFRYGSC